jgi:hypothetical protein
MWKPPSTFAAERTTPPLTVPWLPTQLSTSLSKPETAAVSAVQSSSLVDGEQTTVSTSFQWAPANSGPPASQQNEKSPRPSSVKTICKQWPPQKAPEDEDKPTVNQSSSVASEQVVPPRTVEKIAADDIVERRSKNETTSKVQADSTTPNRCSTLMKDIENCLTDVRQVISSRTSLV